MKNEIIKMLNEYIQAHDNDYFCSSWNPYSNEYVSKIWAAEELIRRLKRSNASPIETVHKFFLQTREFSKMTDNVMIARMFEIASDFAEQLGYDIV